MSPAAVIEYPLLACALQSKADGYPVAAWYAALYRALMTDNRKGDAA
ncbi:hypothetical protein [Streptomyces sp. NBC_01518]